MAVFAAVKFKKLQIHVCHLPRAVFFLVSIRPVGYMKLIIRLKIEQNKGLLGFPVYSKGGGDG